MAENQAKNSPMGDEAIVAELRLLLVGLARPAALDEWRLDRRRAAQGSLAQRAEGLMTAMSPGDPAYAEAVHYRDALKAT